MNGWRYRIEVDDRRSQVVFIEPGGGEMVMMEAPLRAAYRARVDWPAPARVISEALLALEDAMAARFSR